MDALSNEVCPPASFPPRSFSWLRNEAGASLITTLLASAILALAAFSVADAVWSGKVFESRLDRKLSAQRVTLDAANILQNLGFWALVGPQYCAEIDPAFASTSDKAERVGRGPCSSSDSTLSGTQDANFPLNQRRDWQGNVSLKSGPVCVEIRQCRLLAQRRVVEVSLTAFFQAPGKDQPLMRQEFTFRKGRW